MKRFFLLLTLSLALVAGQYARLKDGTVVILKDDGTWEKVESIPRGEQAPAPVEEKKGLSQKDPKVILYKQKLQGEWESFDKKLRYIVKGDELTLVEGRKRKGGPFKITRLDPEKRVFTVDVGEVGKVGFFSFGGFVRKLAFSPDFSTMTDYSATMPTELRKVK